MEGLEQGGCVSRFQFSKNHWLLDGLTVATEVETVKLGRLLGESSGKGPSGF